MPSPAVSLIRNTRQAPAGTHTVVPVNDPLASTTFVAPFFSVQEISLG